jgi:preprotein translocase subunit SecA
MRLFGGDRIYNMMETLGVDETMPIENRLLTGAIESAQQRVEERNFGIRRNVLQYDDVMNRQREVIYGQRNTVLADENVHDSIVKMVEESIRANVAQYTADNEEHTNWNLDGLRGYYGGWLVREDELRYTPQQLEDMERDDISDMLIERAMQIYDAKEKQYGDTLMREVERVVLLQTVDRYWMDHIDNMDELRRGIHLRAIGQYDPVVVYRNEGFDMFEQMVSAIREDTAR